MYDVTITNINTIPLHSDYNSISGDKNFWNVTWSSIMRYMTSSPKTDLLRLDWVSVEPVFWWGGPTSWAEDSRRGRGPPDRPPVPRCSGPWAAWPDRRRGRLAISICSHPESSRSQWTPAPWPLLRRLGSSWRRRSWPLCWCQVVRARRRTGMNHDSDVLITLLGPLLSNPIFGCDVREKPQKLALTSLTKSCVSPLLQEKGRKCATTTQGEWNGLRLDCLLSFFQHSIMVLFRHLVWTPHLSKAQTHKTSRMILFSVTCIQYLSLMP